MLKSCFENWTFRYLPGLLSRLHCAHIKIVWEDFKKLRDGGLDSAMHHSECRGDLYPCKETP